MSGDPAPSGLASFERALEAPRAIWARWLEHSNVVDPEQAGVVVATGRPEADHLAAAELLTECGAEGWV